MPAKLGATLERRCTLDARSCTLDARSCTLDARSCTSCYLDRVRSGQRAIASHRLEDRHELLDHGRVEVAEAPALTGGAFDDPPVRLAGVGERLALPELQVERPLLGSLT